MRRRRRASPTHRRRADPGTNVASRVQARGIHRGERRQHPAAPRRRRRAAARHGDSADSDDLVVPPYLNDRPGAARCDGARVDQRPAADRVVADDRQPGFRGRRQRAGRAATHLAAPAAAARSCRTAGCRCAPRCRRSQRSPPQRTVAEPAAPAARRPAAVAAAARSRLSGAGRLPGILRQYNQQYSPNQYYPNAQYAPNQYAPAQNARAQYAPAQYAPAHPRRNIRRTSIHAQYYPNQYYPPAQPQQAAPLQPLPPPPIPGYQSPYYGQPAPVPPGFAGTRHRAQHGRDRRRIRPDDPGRLRLSGTQRRRRPEPPDRVHRADRRLLLAVLHRHGTAAGDADLPDRRHGRPGVAPAVRQRAGSRADRAADL